MAVNTRLCLLCISPELPCYLVLTSEGSALHTADFTSQCFAFLLTAIRQILCEFISNLHSYSRIIVTNQINRISRSSYIMYGMHWHKPRLISISKGGLVNCRKYRHVNESDTTQLQCNCQLQHNVFLSFIFGVALAPFACQHQGLPHRLAQCATPGKGLV